MSALDRALARARHDAFMSEQGPHPERLEHYKERIKALEAERELQHQQYLESFRILDKLTAQPSKPTPEWYRPMSCDEWIGYRRILRTQCHVEGHQ